MTQPGLPRLIGRWAGLVLAAATTANAASAAYLGAITVGAVAARPRRRRTQSTIKRFAILVPAHDEEGLIGETLAAFHRLDYPRHAFDVHVVADNCADRTAAIVRSCGWTVHERVAPADRGKGPALNWLYDRLDADDRYDVAVVIDADSIVEPNFLTAMNDAFANGTSVAQGFYSVRDPGSSSSAGLRYIALASRHHLRPLGRNRLGGSAGLFGNGMAFEWPLLRRRRWTGHLVEDAEFQLELLIKDGITVTYVPDARLVAEMPSTLEASSGQNERWERGRIELVARYVPVLVRKLTGRGLRRPAAHADALADLVVPPLSVLVATQAAIGVANATVALAGSRRARMRLWIDALALATVIVHIAVSLRAVGAPRSVYRTLAHVPRMILWKVRLWTGVIRPSAHVTWQRTQRNAAR